MEEQVSIRRAKHICFFSMVCAVFISISFSVFNTADTREVKEVNFTFVMCTFDSSYSKPELLIYVWGNLLVFLACMTSLLVLNGLIAHRAYTQRHVHGRTTLMLSVASLVYVCTYLPVLVTLLYLAVSGTTMYEETGVSKSLIILSKYIFYMGCAANPVVYSLVNDKFRQRCRVLLAGIERRGSDSSGLRL